MIEELGKSPARASKFRRLSGIAESMDSVSNKELALPTKISDDDALAHLFFTNMTSQAYIQTRLMSKSNNANIWPVYNVNNVAVANLLCRPKGIEFTESSGIVPLRQRLQHNDKRLLQIFQSKFDNLLDEVAKLLSSREKKKWDLMEVRETRFTTKPSLLRIEMSARRVYSQLALFHSSIALLLASSSSPIPRLRV